MVQSGGCSANDSREVFKKHIEKRVRSLPEIDGLSKETVLSSWMAKFDAIYRGEEDPRKQQARMTASAASELILSKEQLYEMFQNILGIKKFEHQLLYNACQSTVPPSKPLSLVVTFEMFTASNLYEHTYLTCHNCLWLSPIMVVEPDKVIGK
ncbi:calcium-dependent secretion activator 1 [Cricetulus griseus]|nr:calcium-dependent secretion activator 1 [Cricetulus griseus]